VHQRAAKRKKLPAYCAPMHLERTIAKIGEVRVVAAGCRLRVTSAGALCGFSQRQPALWKEAVMHLRQHRGVGHNNRGAFALRRDHLCYVFAWARGLDIAVIVNGYMPGDSIRHHSDDEEGIVTWLPIMTYSLGRAATFEVQNKKTGKMLAVSTALEGTRIDMHGEDFQSLFTHGVPSKNKQATPRGARCDYRMSITLRVCMPIDDVYSFRHVSLPAQRKEWPCEEAEEDAVWKIVKLCCADALPHLDCALEEHEA
jgi:hypothetical protein